MADQKPPMEMNKKSDQTKEATKSDDAMQVDEQRKKEAEELASLREFKRQSQLKEKRGRVGSLKKAMSSALKNVDSENMEELQKFVEGLDQNFDDLSDAGTEALEKIGKILEQYVSMTTDAVVTATTSNDQSAALKAAKAENEALKRELTEHKQRAILSESKAKLDAKPASTGSTSPKLKRKASEVSKKSEPSEEVKETSANVFSVDFASLPDDKLQSTLEAFKQHVDAYNQKKASAEAQTSKPEIAAKAAPAAQAPTTLEATHAASAKMQKRPTLLEALRDPNFPIGDYIAQIEQRQ